MALRRALSQGRRLFHFHSPTSPTLIRQSVLPPPFNGGGLADRIRVDVLSPSLPSTSPSSSVQRKFIDEAKESPARTRARVDEILKLNNQSTAETGPTSEIGKTIDNVTAGDAVIVLRLDEVVRVIESVVKKTNDKNIKKIDKEEKNQVYKLDKELLKELEMMQEKKSEIDRKAETGVRRELWGGLTFFTMQTIGFMRLTFWELSWDVMEPVCFFVTSLYFIAGYAFFLRTSREPSFEGIFESRFLAKQRKLIRAHEFDVNRFNELVAITEGSSSSSRSDSRELPLS